MTKVERWLAAEYLWLKRRIRQVLAELELTSCGVTANPRGNGGGAFESMPPKTGDWSPPWVRLRRLFAEATTNDRRRELVAEAEHELELVKKTRPLPKNFREETQAERVQRMLREGLGASPADISRSRLKMSEREVRRYRTLHGRNPETGEVDDLMRPMPDGTPDERDERMRAMLAAGYSQRQAAHVLCVDQSTISRRWARLYRDIAASRAAA